MNTHNFIFSRDVKTSILRHFLSWTLLYLLMIVTYPPRGAGSANGIAADGFISFYRMVLIRNFAMILCQALFCYLLLYILLPVFFYKKKYVQFAIMLLLSWVITAIFRYTTYRYFYNPVMQHFHYHTNNLSEIYLFSVRQTISGPAFIGGLFIALKLFKDWQQKQLDNINLIKENAFAELHLLKAQIQPHFLFNTLNNIYSFTLNKSPKAGEMVLQLSDMMEYMINDCEAEVVPLDKELKVIDEYISLEKVRYGSRLDMKTEITGPVSNKLIAPLLMIPFIENSFKHGASKMLRATWIQLFIQADENVLHFTLVNSKPANEIAKQREGIGLSNVKKRLELLYPSSHLLAIKSTTNTFTVNMQIPLQQNNRSINLATEEKIVI